MLYVLSFKSSTSGLQEVITNEHVVAMMKAAINETEAVPPFVSVYLMSSKRSQSSYNVSVTFLLISF